MGVGVPPGLSTLFITTHTSIVVPVFSGRLRVAAVKVIIGSANVILKHTINIKKL